MVEYLLIGIALGISAGFSPGPLTALIISETLLYGFRSGLKICFAPIFTDIIIVPITILLLSHINSHLIIGIISLVGAVYVTTLGIKNIKFNGQIKLNLQRTRSLQKGIITNFLSPSPYLFWTTIGGPIFLKGNNETHCGGYIFVAIFYLVMINVKIFISAISAKSKEFLKGKTFTYVIKTTGVLLVLLALFLLKTGIEQLR